MPQFPTAEREIVNLALNINSGYIKHADDFPHRSPKIIYYCARFQNAKITQQNAAAKAAAAKKSDTALSELINLMKNCLKKAQVDTIDNPEKLHLIGWAPRRKPVPVKLPGCPVNLTAETNNMYICLKWDSPAESIVKNYIIEARTPGGQWQIFDISYSPQLSFRRSSIEEITEFRVRATNCTGKGIPGNTATVNPTASVSF